MIKLFLIKEGIELCFITTNILPYPQRSQSFYPNLSIIDMLMNLGFMEVKDKHLPSYTLTV